MYQNDAQKVLTGEVRLSYCNLIQPRAPLSGQGDPKYSVTILIPKTDVATKADIDASIEAAARMTPWASCGAVCVPASIPSCGTATVRAKTVMPFGSECKGHWVLTASTKQKPQVVGIDNINAEACPAGHLQRHVRPCDPSFLRLFAVRQSRRGLRTRQCAENPRG